MMKSIHSAIMCLFILNSCGGGANGSSPSNTTARPITNEIKLSLIASREVWDKGLHSAFTDLVIFNNKYYITFREAAGHNTEEGNGSIRVICFTENGPIEEVAHLKMTADLRDPKLLIRDNNLYVTFSGITINATAQTRNVTNYISDLSSKSINIINNSITDWLWRLSHIDSNWMGFSYNPNSLPDDFEKGKFVVLGENFSIVENIGSQVSGECTIRQTPNQDVYALCRQRDNSMKFGRISTIPSRQFAWVDITPTIAGPNFVALNNEQGLVSGRFYGSKGLRTSVAEISFRDGNINELLRLPSGGDTGYPGMALKNNFLYMSHYYQPKNSTSTVILFSKIQVQASW